MRPTLQTAGVVSLLAGVTGAIQVDFTNDDSIKDAASTAAFGLLKYYTGNNTGDTPGNLPDPYFWWEAGAMFGTMIDYWFYTGDETYNDVTTQAMVHQAGEDNDYMPQNQTRTLGNDDQGFWAMAAMSAAENNFPNPPDGQPQWLALVQAVFNEYVSRWDPNTCGGGLRWQIFTFNNGFNYKNSISNGCFFNIASRLARYTGNQTYADWAEKVWDWMEEVKFIDQDFNIFDGGGVENNCVDINKAQWTYNAGIFLQGTAMMYNVTETDTWKQRVEGLVSRTVAYFFDDGIVVERPCESFNSCDFDQQSFKGYLMRWMASASQMAPFTFDTLMPLVKSSAAAAAQQCSGSPPATDFKGQPGTACGFKWTAKAAFDGLAGVGEQMSALSAMQYTLVKKQEAKAPVTADTGGTSVGNPNAGRPPDEYMPMPVVITTGEKVAAGFLTTAVAFSVMGASFFIMKE
ncbi:glycoside hydrolase family 76 protein [Hypoxylon rubiginosum]|uniref:Glycoside hydrolase family 76 protein n=1 Tax=Hypoxylon rubiginosum TaxID=110542 RepID=A0ACB9YUV5_9PEZI|nr:glycoside hydrolase family 76 protein [Hypoxylon rubiginosum]